MKKPIFEKVNDGVIRITSEQVEEIPIVLVMSQKQQLLEKRKQLDKVLEQMDNLLAEAKKLGITPQLPKKSPKK